MWVKSLGEKYLINTDTGCCFYKGMNRCHEATINFRTPANYNIVIAGYDTCSEQDECFERILTELKEDDKVLSLSEIGDQ